MRGILEGCWVPRMPLSLPLCVCAAVPWRWLSAGGASEREERGGDVSKRGAQSVTIGRWRFTSPPSQSVSLVC